VPALLVGVEFEGVEELGLVTPPPEEDPPPPQADNINDKSTATKIDVFITWMPTL